MEAFELDEGKAVTAIIKSVPKLPVVPAMFHTLRRLLADAGADLREIGATVQQDPGIAAKVLQLANSVVFRRGAPIANIEAAVMRLGSAAISRLVMVESILATNFPVARFKFDEEARRYFMASLVAECVASPPLRDEASLAVLLCPIGRLIMMAADPERMERVMMNAGTDTERMLVEERVYYGTTHAAVGAHLIATWGLPSSVARAVARQFDPHAASEDDEVVTAAVLANRDIRGMPSAAPGAFVASWERHKARVAFVDKSFAA